MPSALTASWIAGLMRENYEAVGFIPEPAVERQYIRQGRFIEQRDERGRMVGYILHGVLQPGRSLSVAQHCIQYDSRLKGYGEAALRELVRRAEQIGASGITARCATDLPSLEFWQAQGFQLKAIVHGGERRRREIACLWLPLDLPLFGGQYA